MRTIYIKIIIPILMLAGSSAFAQQAYTYTQYMSNLTAYNTAYSVISEAGSINALGRKQWVGIEGAPTSFVFSGSIPLKAISGTVGLVAMQDKFGIENLTEVSAFYAKSVQLSSNTYLAASINAGFRKYNAVYSQLDAYDPKFNNDIRENAGTIGTSILYYDPERFYIGASLPRLSIRSLGKASVEDTRNNKNTWYFSAAYLFELDDNFKLKPASLVSYTQTLPALFDISATLYIQNRIGIGAGYRSSKEAAAVLSYFFDNNINIGYSYQASFGALKVGATNSGTHEITVGFRFGDIVKPGLL